MHSQSASLMEVLARKAGCITLSDLRYLSPKEREHLAWRIASIPSHDFSLREWNDALQYLARAPTEMSIWDARKRLVEYLAPSSKNERDLTE